MYLQGRWTVMNISTRTTTATTNMYQSPPLFCQEVSQRTSRFKIRVKFNKSYPWPWLEGDEKSERETLLFSRKVSLIFKVIFQIRCIGWSVVSKGYQKLMFILYTKMYSHRFKTFKKFPTLLLWWSKSGIKECQILECY